MSEFSRSSLTWIPDLHFNEERTAVNRGEDLQCVDMLSALLNVPVLHRWGGFLCYLSQGNLDCMLMEIRLIPQINYACGNLKRVNNRWQCMVHNNAVIFGFVTVQCACVHVFNLWDRVEIISWCETASAFYFSLPSTRIPTNNIVAMETHILINPRAALPWRSTWLPPLLVNYRSAGCSESVWIPALSSAKSVRDRQAFNCRG